MKPFEYDRKSTKDKEDQQVLSMSGQHEENVKVAERNGHTIVGTFEEEASAKQPGREQFNKMLLRIERGEADSILCWRLNRLARNPIDGGRIQWMLQQGILKAIITPEKTYLPTDNVIQMSVEFGMATQFSIDLGKDVMRGMLQKAKMGWRPGIAPVGYLNDYGGIKGEKKIFKDLERFDLVRRCWDYLLTGAYTIEEIYDIAIKEWEMTVVRGRKKIVRPIGFNTLYDIFHNSFYYGEYDWGGQTWQGLHEPMISREEYDRAQEIIGARGRPRKQTHENPYPCLIQCGECGGSIVIDVKKKFVKRENRTKILEYFRCGKQKKKQCTQKHCLRRELLDPQILGMVMAAELPQAFIDWALEKLKMTQEDKKKEREQELNRLQESHRVSEKKVNDFIDMRLENPTLFPADTFKRKLESLELDVKRCEAQVNNYGKVGRTWREEFIDKLLFIEKAQEKFIKALDPKVRIGMLSELKESLELTDRELTFRLQEPFSTFMRGKLRMEAKLGSLEPINCRLPKVKTEVLEKVIPIWSRLGDSNPGP
jgi:site-specific DNA recombinase